MMLMPLLLTAFLLPSAKAQLQAADFAHATGAEQLVPGMAVMFAFMMGMNLVATLFYREHAWGTWERVRAGSTSTLDLVLGKTAPLYAFLLAQMAILFVIGRLFFGFDPNGSLLALALVAAAFVASLVAFGVMLVATCSTLDQVLMFGNLGGMIMSGIGGALAPASSLPGWAQWLAHGTPPYWALNAFRDISLEGAGVTQTAGSMAILLAFALAFTGIAALRFRPADPKVGTT
jgi:ABC-2 type transport system permease protein